jgi:hypothetical protein
MALYGIGMRNAAPGASTQHLGQHLQLLADLHVHSLWLLCATHGLLVGGARAQAAVWAVDTYGDAWPFFISPWLLPLAQLYGALGISLHVAMLVTSSQVWRQESFEGHCAQLMGPQ